MGGEYFTVGNLCVQCHSSLIRPAPGHITNCVATPTQHQHRQVKALDELHTLGMTWRAEAKRKIKITGLYVAPSWREPTTPQLVSPTKKEHSTSR